MGQQAQEQEDGVDGVQVQIGHADGDEEVNDVQEAGDDDDAPQDLAVLHLLGGGLNLVLPLLLVLEQGGINDDGVLFVRVHGVVDQGHAHQDYQAHDDVHGVQNGLGQRRLVYNTQELLAALGGHLQGDGAGEAGVPDDETGVGGGDQQGIVHIIDAAGHLFGQQGAHDEAEAPVQPAAEGGHRGNHHDGAHLALGKAGNGVEDLFADLGGGQSGTQHQHQGHLHGEGQQAPHAVAALALAAPGPNHLPGTLLRAQARGDEDHDGQDDGEQEWIRQPPVHDAHASVGEFFQH